LRSSTARVPSATPLKSGYHLRPERCRGVTPGGVLLDCLLRGERSGSGVGRAACSRIGRHERKDSGTGRGQGGSGGAWPQEQGEGTDAGWCRTVAVTATAMRLCPAATRSHRGRAEGRRSLGRSTPRPPQSTRASRHGREDGPERLREVDQDQDDGGARNGRFRRRRPASHERRAMGRPARRSTAQASRRDW